MDAAKLLSFHRYGQAASGNGAALARVYYGLDPTIGGRDDPEAHVRGVLRVLVLKLKTTATAPQLPPQQIALT